MNAILRLPIVKRACNFLIFQCSWNSRWSLLNEVHYLFSLKCFDKLECSIGLLYVQFLYLHKKCEFNKFPNLRFAHLLSFFVQVHVFSLLPTLVLKKKRGFYLIKKKSFSSQDFWMFKVQDQTKSFGKWLAAVVQKPSKPPTCGGVLILGANHRISYHLVITDLRPLLSNDFFEFR